jgi:FtsP/CotA-like multicopper oxidase with cupredoxin domain
MNRRAFLKSLALGVSGAAFLPFFARNAIARKVEITPLPIPEMLEGKMVDGVRIYDLKVQRGVHEFFHGVKTPTLGINAPYLGSTLKMRVGEKIRLNVTNDIGEPTTLHWHGMHLPAKADGGPHQVIAPGTTWSPEFEVKQQAATFWYHSHLHKKTGEQVWRGLAGMIIVEDMLSDKLDLPNTYGVDDIPVVLQDRSFYRDGSLAYDTSMHSVMMGLNGDVAIANGKVFPQVLGNASKMRLRLLNGSNASFYNLGFNDNRAFHQIASDGSFLEQPVEMQRVLLGPGERAEIVVDISDGKNINLFSDGGMPSGGGMMGGGRGMMGRGGMMDGGSSQYHFLQIVGGDRKKSADLPARLLKLDRLEPASAAKTRRFSLDVTMGPMVMMGLSKPVAINGKVMDMNRIDEVVKLGDTEIWEISNPSPMPHPFHIHDIQFQILDRNGRRPPANERGLKDTVIVNSGETVRVIAKFDDYADPDRPFMYHCHILEHEDAGMMGQFTVVS